MGFFKCLMICFDAFAWPIFALGYPLVASVQAIETNSDSECRKLVTYWVLFSLISLFEHAFMDLVEWVSDWPYLKLMMVYWLMIPRFDGAFHVYNNFIHPCLYMDLQTIIKDLFAKRENFLKEAEKYVKANYGLEASGKLISSSKSESTERGIMQKDSENAYTSATSPALQVHGNKVVVTPVKQADNKISPPMEIKGVANPRISTFQPVQGKWTWIPKAGLNVDKNNIKRPPPVEFKAAAKPGISTSQQVHKEWTCAMCQVIVSSEIELKSHLQGSQHNATCEELKKAKNQSSKGRAPAPSKHPERNLRNVPAATNVHIRNLTKQSESNQF